MTEMLRHSLAQRADYTHKHNAESGRHGWLRLTPAYSLKIVDEVLRAYEESTAINVFDPFCGTGTTALCAAHRGYTAVTVEINPFLVWFSRTKTDSYSTQVVSELNQIGHAVSDDVRHGRTPGAPAPRMYNIERWWNAAALDFLCALKGAIDSKFAEESKQRSLLLVAFCRTLIHLSNAAFNHQSMSFKLGVQTAFDFDIDLCGIFIKNLNFVLGGARQNPAGRVCVRRADSRRLAKRDADSVDCVITSPPYANRMSYIRELRPYMYWLGYLVDGRDAGEMDWEAIGGTWGIATSRLEKWSAPSHGYQSGLLSDAVKRIRKAENRNGRLLANYVSKYFSDMWSHFQSLIGVLNPGAKVHYIVGNSTFYGVLVPVEQIYADMLSRLGFSNVECVPIRKRNSKKELIEFDVRAHWK